MIDRFARWHLMHKLRLRAHDSPITTGAFLNVKQSTTPCYIYSAVTDYEDDLADEFGDLSDCFNAVDFLTDDLGLTDTNE